MPNRMLQSESYMKNTIYSVAIVVDKNFGEILSQLAGRLPVWICGSPGNLPFIDKMWMEAKEFPFRNINVTKFQNSDHQSPEEMLINQLDVVDLHHGQLSQCPSWSILEIYGALPNIHVEKELNRFGEGQIDVFQNGFMYTRSIE